MPRNDIAYLQHILDAINRIEEYLLGVTEADFHNRYLIQDGVIRQIEIIGEATKQLSKEMFFSGRCYLHCKISIINFLISICSNHHILSMPDNIFIRFEHRCLTRLTLVGIRNIAYRMRY
jgi:hypothetical protein